MYRTDQENQFLEVTTKTRQGDPYFKDFASAR